MIPKLLKFEGKFCTNEPGILFEAKEIEYNVELLCLVCNNCYINCKSQIDLENKSLFSVNL